MRIHQARQHQPRRSSITRPERRATRRLPLIDLASNLVPCSSSQTPPRNETSISNKTPKTPKTKPKARSVSSSTKTLDRTAVTWGCPCNADTKTPRASNRAARPIGPANVLGREKEEPDRWKGQHAGNDGSFAPKQPENDDMDLDTDASSEVSDFKDSLKNANVLTANRSHKSKRGFQGSFEHFGTTAASGQRLDDTGKNHGQSMVGSTVADFQARREDRGLQQQTLKHVPANNATLKVVYERPLSKPSRTGPLSGLEIGGRRTRLAASLDEEDNITLDSRLEPAGRREQFIDHRYTRGSFKSSYRNKSSGEYDSIATNESLDFVCVEPWTQPEDERSVHSREFTFELDGMGYSHPPLPSGWTMQVRPVYSHPERGHTTHCPVVLPLKSKRSTKRFGRGGGIFQPAEMKRPRPARNHAFLLNEWGDKEASSWPVDDFSHQATQGSVGSVDSYYSNPIATAESDIYYRDQDSSLGSPTPSEVPIPRGLKFPRFTEARENLEAPSPSDIMISEGPMMSDTLETPSPSNVKVPEGLMIGTNRQRTQQHTANSAGLGASQAPDDMGIATQSAQDVLSSKSGSISSSASAAKGKQLAATHYMPEHDKEAPKHDQAETGARPFDEPVEKLGRQAKDTRQDDASVEGKSPERREENASANSHPVTAPSDDDTSTASAHVLDSPDATKPSFEDVAPAASKGEGEDSLVPRDSLKKSYEQDGAESTEKRKHHDESMASGHTEITTPTQATGTVSSPSHLLFATPYSDERNGNRSSFPKRRADASDSKHERCRKKSAISDNTKLSPRPKLKPMERVVVLVAAHATRRKKDLCRSFPVDEISDRESPTSTTSSPDELPSVNLDEAMFPDREVDESEIGSPFGSMRSTPSVGPKRRRKDPGTSMSRNGNFPSRCTSDRPPWMWYESRPESLQKLEILRRRGKYKYRFSARPKSKHAFVEK